MNPNGITISGLDNVNLPINVTQSNGKVVKTYSSFDPPVPCKCGTLPEVGMTFYYTSKYSGDVVEGVIDVFSGPFSIVSTNGAMYKNEEIEIKPLHIKRDEKLRDLGI